MRRLAIVTISHAVLEGAMALPPDYEILEVEQTAQGRHTGTFRVVLQGPGLPEVPEASALPEVEWLVEIQEGGALVGRPVNP